MPLLPKLSPLQSRLAACLLAPLMVFVVYFVLTMPQFAYAADLVEPVPMYDTVQEQWGPMGAIEPHLETHASRDVGYEANLMGVEAGVIERVPSADTPTPLINNRMVVTNVEQGQLLSFSFLNASVFGPLSPVSSGLPDFVRLRSTMSNTDVLEATRGDLVTGNPHENTPRQTDSSTSRPVYFSVNTCIQPTPNDNSIVELPPQLQLFVSQSEQNTNPGPSQNPFLQQMMSLTDGFGLITINATGDVFIGLYGPETTTYKGVWNAQIAASIDAPYHYYNNGSDPNLFLVDSDSTSGLLVTGDLTDASVNSTIFDEWLDSALPYVLFASNNAGLSINGLQGSYCALQQHAIIGPGILGDGNSTQSGITVRGDGQPKQQFYIGGLSSGSTYSAYLAMSGNSTDSGNGVVGGGGQVWPQVNFTTLSGGNCAVIFNLSFCDQTAYAVPSNPQNFANVSSLSAFYDNNTQAQYQYFQNALGQVACETTASAQYSLVRTCSDCAVAYKNWLCSVTIPRCTDFSSELPWLQPRAMGQPFPNGTFLPSSEIAFWNQTVPFNSSRNPNIDQSVQPGPYKEILPCATLCQELVQSCPASLGFFCPRPGRTGYNTTYGEMPDPNIAQQVGQVTCNYPGVTFDQLSGTAIPFTPHRIWITILAMVTLILLS